MVAARYLRVEFVDGNPVVPTLSDRGEEADGGRGLRLVDALTTAWGVQLYPAGGKGVWFELGSRCGARKALSPIS